jgi:histidinol-phosphate aminotransferase
VTAALTPPPFTPLVDSLPATVPFVGPEALVRRSGRPITARLGANESVFGPSPQAISAMTAAAHDVWMYGDPELFDLKAALATASGCRPDNIAIGHGIDGLFGLTVRLFVGPGTPVVTSLGAYPTFNFHVSGYGGHLITVPYAHDREDPVALLSAAAQANARLVYLANPDNPMGTWWPGAEIARMVERLPAHCLLCLDEAYGEFAPEGSRPDLDPDDPRVLRFRTFSKVHGMAGLRVGYAIGAPRIVAAFDRIRDHFAIGRIAQAGAIAGIADTEHVRNVAAQVQSARIQIVSIATANGLKSVPSATNFVAVDCGRDGAFAARVLEGLLARGIFVRKPGVAPLDRCIRVSAGRPEHLRQFAAAFPLALADAAGHGEKS